MADTAKIHFAYVIGILLAIIVALITIQWGSIRDLVNYISFALTITSLVLALLAIIYSYFSNATFGQNISTLNGASQQMSRSASELGVATAALRDRVDDIPGALETMGRRFEETRGAIASLAERTAAQTAPSSEEEAPKTEPAQRFLSNAPLSGQLALYAASRGAALNRPVSFSKLGESVRYMSEDYTFGFIVAAALAGVLDRSGVSPDGVVIRSIDPLIAAKIRDRVFQVAAELDESRKKPAGDGAKSFSQEIGEIMAMVDAIVEGRTLPPSEVKLSPPVGGAGT